MDKYEDENSLVNRNLLWGELTEVFDIEIIKYYNLGEKEVLLLSPLIKQSCHYTALKSNDLFVYNMNICIYREFYNAQVFAQVFPVILFKSFLQECVRFKQPINMIKLINLLEYKKIVVEDSVQIMNLEKIYLLERG